VIASAVKKFYEKYGYLPLPGSLPDMKAQSKVYVKLQGIYKAKARRDAQEVLEIAKALHGGKDVDPVEVEMFCKNASFVKLVNATTQGRQLMSIYGNFHIILQAWIISLTRHTQTRRRRTTRWPRT
jgi:NEDD8-activating enzyme E1 regulatory subunit